MKSKTNKKAKEEVIFIQDAYPWGKIQEVKKIARGFAVHLMKQGKILLATRDNLNWLEKEILTQKKTQEIKEKSLEEKNHDLYQKINNQIFSFSLQKNKEGKEIGVIDWKKINSELENKGIKIDKKQVISFEPFNQVGEKIIKVKISNNLIADLKIIII